MTIYSTIWSDDADFNRRVTVLDWRRVGWSGLPRAMRRAGPQDVVLINGALGFGALWRDMASACALRAAGRRFKLVVADATWEPRSDSGESRAGALWVASDRFNRAMVRRLADDQTVFCFLSTEEVERFLGDQHGLPARAVYTPFHVTAPPKYLAGGATGARRRQGEPPYVFSGGNALRDWDLLVEALDDCGVEVRVATRHTARAWPANFRVGPLGHDEFFEVAAGATAAALALRADVGRSGGQQTYLNLLRLGVPVVVNDAPGVRDHLTGMPAAMITGAKDASAMRESVAWLCDPANRATLDDSTATAVRRIDEAFSESTYLARLVSICERA